MALFQQLESFLLKYNTDTVMYTTKDDINNNSLPPKLFDTFLSHARLVQLFQPYSSVVY